MPLPSPWFWAIAILYALLGLVGHDPWKQDDAVGFGIAWSMANGTLPDWLIPNVAGQMVPEEGPLAFWLAALLVRTLGSVIYAHDAARLASGIWAMIAIYATYRAARSAFGDAEGRFAMLALLACPGLLARTHEVAAEPAFIAACALLLWALAATPSRAHHSQGIAWMTAAVGTTLGVAALARGLPATLTLCVALLLLSVFDAAWRTPRHLVVLGGGVAIGLFLFTLWTRSTVALVDTDGPVFTHHYARWMAAQYGGLSAGDARYTAKTLAWFIFPIWPIAVWWIARRPKSFLGEAEPRRFHLPALALAAATLVSFAWTRHVSEATFLPLLPACAVFAVPAISRLARGMAAAVDWFGRITFTLGAALIWLGYCALQSGWPPRIAANFARLEPGYAASFSVLPFLIAVAATLAWLVVIARSERTVLRAITHWAYGITLLWLLLMTLWLPWINYGKSYQSVATGLRTAMGAHLRGSCMEARNLGLAERASLGYLVDVPFGPQCTWVIEQARNGDAIATGAKLVWEGHRPGEKHERFRLYKK